MISSLYIINRKRDYYPFADTSFPGVEIAKPADGWEWQHFNEEKTNKGSYVDTGSFDFLTWLFGIMEFGQ